MLTPTTAMNYDQFPFLKAAAEKQANPLMQIGTRALALGGKAAPAAGRALAKVAPTRIFPRAMPGAAQAGGKIVGLSPLGKGTLAAGGLAAGASLLPWGGGESTAKPAAPAPQAKPTASGMPAGVMDLIGQSPQQRAQNLQGQAAGIAAGQAARGGSGELLHPKIQDKGVPLLRPNIQDKGVPLLKANPSSPGSSYADMLGIGAKPSTLGSQNPAALDQWIGGQTSPNIPDTGMGTSRRALEGHHGGNIPTGAFVPPDGVLGADTLAGQGMTMTGPGAGFAAGVPVRDQGAQKAMPPLPSPAQPDFDFNSAFQKYHGTSYNPNSTMDQGKMQQMRELYQQNGNLSAASVYGRQYGKQAAARLKVTHPRLGAMLEKSARADSDAYVSPGRAGIAGGLGGAALAGTYAGTKTEDTPSGVMHGLGTFAGSGLGAVLGGLLGYKATDPGTPGFSLNPRHAQDHLNKVTQQQFATLGGAQLGGMAGGGITSALLAHLSNKQRGAVKPEFEAVGTKKKRNQDDKSEKADKPKDDSENDEPKEKEAGFGGAAAGALGGAALGAVPGLIHGSTVTAPGFNNKGRVLDILFNLIAGAPSGTPTIGEESAVNTGLLMGSGAGLGAGLGGILGHKLQENARPDEEESLDESPAKMAHYAIKAAELCLLEKAANGGVGALLGALLGGGAGYVGHAMPGGRENAGVIGGKLGELAAPVVNAATLRPSLSSDPAGALRDLFSDASRKQHYRALGSAFGQDPQLGRAGATAAGAGVGAMAGGAIGSLMGKKKKPKEEDETDQEEESLGRPAKMAHYAMLAAELSLIEKQAAPQISSRRVQTPQPVKTPVDFRHMLRHAGQKLTEDSGRGLNPLNRAATDVLRDGVSAISSDQTGGDDLKAWGAAIGLPTNPWGMIADKLKGKQNPYDRVFSHQMRTAQPDLGNSLTSASQGMRDYIKKDISPGLEAALPAYENLHGKILPR